MTRYEVNDEEFEKLSFHEQRNYRWCQQCETYYHVDSNHTCNNFKPVDSDENEMKWFEQNAFGGVDE